MLKMIRLTDGECYYAAPPAPSGRCGEELIVRHLAPDGAVGEPMRMPAGMLRFAGYVTLSSDGKRWIAADSQPPGTHSAP